jgi:two-component system sensor histidine kinase KdpD
MIVYRLNRTSKAKQYLIGILSIVVVSTICYFLSAYIGYKVVALILLLIVSVFALFFDIYPVLTLALLSALIWDFFFIPPKFTFYVSETEDVLLLIMYMAIALIHAVLTYKNKQWEKIARKREEKRTALKLYNTLLNSLSHELRTPISTIIGATDTLKTGKSSLSEIDKDELIAEISKSSLRLNGQVENLLNMSRLESGVIKPIKEPCDINELIHEVKNHLREYSSDHKIKIQVEENMPLFNLDYGLISQSIYNLVYNAILYTPANSVITICASYRLKNLILCVEDSGKGFPEEEIENVFEKFYRLKDSGTGGTGLGLSIVRGFIEAHKGTIRLENTEGGGAKFTIEIPAEKSAIKNLVNE